MANDGVVITLPVALQALQLVVILGGGLLVAFRVGRATERMELTLRAQAKIAELQAGEIASLKDEVRKLGEVLTKLALADQRMNMMQQQIDELRHGEGMVIPLHKSSYERP